MVAVTVITLLLTTIYGVFASVSGSKERLEKRGESFHRARVLFDRIGREVRGAYYSKDNPDTLFAGGNDEDGLPFLTLATTATTPLSGQAEGIAAVRYTLRPDTESDGDGQVLLRSEQPLFSDAGGQGREYRLTTGVTEMQLRFYADGSWEDEWDSGLPEMVELTLTVSVDGVATPFRSSFDVPKL